MSKLSKLSKSVAVTAFVGGISVLGAGAALAAPPTNLAAPAVNPNPVAPKAAVTVSGTGCLDPNQGTALAEVLLGINNPDGSTYTETIPADANGAWSTTLTATDAAGVYTITARCDTYSAQTSYPNAKITVAAAGGTTTPAANTGNGSTVNAGTPTTPTKELAATGTDATALLPAAAGMLALGGVALFAGRRKHDD
ncbi:LPXTG cell wall anchor domain-containing protein [Antricoccus suffuscus]|uniref:LPXTG cell wall anchor domain-containing protein n=1 Tax=Antricoccus suffuscus TaxID=1629062 RepID=UPI0014731515|nr:LPXTG cell wall anchor domain-containing protein [Antricoccus suffuscus]